MVQLSIHPVHPFLQPYFQNHAILRLPNPEIKKPVEKSDELFTALPVCSLMFFLGPADRSISGNLGGLEFKSRPGRVQQFDGRQIYLVGIKNEPARGAIASQTDVFFSIFKPAGAQYFLKDSAAVSVNQNLNFDTLSLTAAFDGLAERLQGVSDNRRAVQLVEQYLLAFIARHRIPFSVKDMTPVADYICRQNGMVQVGSLEEKFRLGRRWLEKQFAEQVGTSPKEYARLVRFKSMLTKSNLNPQLTFSALMDAYGYYDLSHLNRDFQRYTGCAPSRFVKNEATGMNEVIYGLV